MKNEYETEVYTYEKKTKKGKTARYTVKFNKLAMGLLLIACAIFLVLDAVDVNLGFISGIPAFTLILSAFFIVSILNDIIKLRINGIFFSAAFLFMLLEKYIAKWAGIAKTNIINNWLLLLVALLLTIGCHLIFPKKRTFVFKHDGKRSENSEKGGSLCSSTVYIDCSNFEIESVVNELGSCQVFFSNVENYEGNGILKISNELGSMKINVPSEWKIVANVKNELGSVVLPDDTPDDTDGAKLLQIVGSNELGSVSITRI